MKNKTFAVRLVNLLLVAGVLCGYQGVLVYRGQEEKIAYLNSQVESLKLTLTAAEAAVREGTAGGITAEAVEREAGTDAAEGTSAAGAGEYADGSYSGEAEGFGGPIAVEVTVSGGEITEIRVTSAEQEDAAYLNLAEGVTDAMIEAQTADVDTVSGATYSSLGIIGAVQNALEKAVR